MRPGQGWDMKKLLLGIAMSCVLLTSVAQAAEKMSVMPPEKWFVHVGATGVFFNSGLDSISVGGFSPPGAAAHVTDNITANLEIGRYLTDHVSMSLFAGIPPTNDVVADGTIAGLGRLGSATYGAIILGAQYHFNMMGKLKPYLGAGVSYDAIFSNSDGALKSFHVDNGVGVALQAGTEIDLSEHLGLFVDVKKLFASAHATGLEPTMHGLAPVDATLHLNPWIVSAGLNLRF